MQHLVTRFKHDPRRNDRERQDSVVDCIVVQAIGAASSVGHESGKCHTVGVWKREVSNDCKALDGRLVRCVRGCVEGVLSVC